MNSPRVAEVVAQDIADGKTLKVTKTPGFFVNGKPLVDFGCRSAQGFGGEGSSQRLWEMRSDNIGRSAVKGHGHRCARRRSTRQGAFAQSPFDSFFLLTEK
jgi:hypothetical protein